MCPFEKESVKGAELKTLSSLQTSKCNLLLGGMERINPGMVFFEHLATELSFVIFVAVINKSTGELYLDLKI